MIIQNSIYYQIIKKNTTTIAIKKIFTGNSMQTNGMEDVALLCLYW